MSWNNSPTASYVTQRRNKTMAHQSGTGNRIHQFGKFASLKHFTPMVLLFEASTRLWAKPIRGAAAKTAPPALHIARKTCNIRVYVWIDVAKGKSMDSG